MDDIVVDRQSCVAGCTCLLCLAWQENCRLTAEIERLRTALQIAAGKLSTLPPFTDWHPETIYKAFLEDGEKEARRG